MKPCISVLTLLFCVTILSAQDVSYEELKFHTQLEAEAFSVARLDEPSDLSEKIGLLTALDPAANENRIAEIEQRIQLIINDLEKQKLLSKKRLKAAKLLFSTVHEGLLVKYDEDAQFNDIFENGRYNCVTASALYALVMNAMELPYAVREIPGHVYVVFDPAGEHLVLESTNPSSGVFQIDKEEVIEMLLDQKAISESEYKSKSTAQLYEEYFNTHDREITFTQLAGDLYYNRALMALEQEDFRLAEDFAAKAVYLNPSEFSRWAWGQSLVFQAGEFNFTDPTSFRPLFKLQYFPDYQELAVNNLIINFNNASEELLIAKNQPDSYQALRRYYVLNLSASLIQVKQDIDFVHFFQKARHHGLQGQLEPAFSFLDSAYVIQPTHLAIQEMLRDVVFQKVQSFLNEDKKEELLVYVREMNDRYAFLASTKRFYQLLLYAEFADVIDGFEENQEADALAAFAACKHRITELDDGSDTYKEIIGNLFGSASSYYFRITNEKEAQRWLDEGLKIVPDNEELLRKKRMLDDFYGK